MTDMVDETRVKASVVVARLPVVDKVRSIVGFELVHRETSEHPQDRLADEQNDADEAMVTRTSLLGSVDINLSAVVGNKLLFCTVDREALLSETRLNLPSRKTVLQVPTRDVDDGYLAAVRSYSRDGFAIMVEHTATSANKHELLALADMVKIDLKVGTPGDVMDIVDLYRELDTELVAVGCETEAELAWAQAVGFDLFMGHAIQVQADRTISESASAPMALSQIQLGLELLDHDRDFDLNHVEDVLRGDPALVMQLLNMASAGAGGGMRRQVRSLREALVFMGAIRLRQWAALVILSHHSQRQTDSMVTALVRARMCELMAPSRGIDGQFAFTAGLLSAFNIVLGVSVAEVEGQVTVGEDLTRASFRREGPVGALINRVEDHERWLVGSTIRDDHDEVTLVGGEAFAWAARYAEVMEAARPA